MKEKGKSESFLTTYLDRHRLTFIGKGVLVGLLAGLVVSLFRLGIHALTHQVIRFYHFATEHPLWLIPWLGLSLIVAIFIGRLVKQEPAIKGSGIPQVEGQVAGVLTINWWSVLWRKTIAGLLSISSGLFLGREGPSIQLGAAVGDGVNSWLNGNATSKKILISSGAGAGLAAAFNAPLAGLVFVLEEIHHHFSPIVLLSAFSATVSANFVSQTFFGLSPILHFGALEKIPLRFYPWLVGLGILLGVIGYIYQLVLLAMPRFYKKLRHLPSHYWGVVPFICVIPIGFFFPHLLGGGSQVISLLETQSYSFQLLLGIFLLRFIFSMISYGSGLPGGIFLPVLSLGAILGTLYVAALPETWLPADFKINFIILGMAGFFTAVGKAPLTAIILITEMTGNFQQLMTLSIVALVAYITLDLLGGEPIYEALLERLDTKAVPLTKGTKELLAFPVQVGSFLDGRPLMDATLPSGCLVASIRRGERELIPSGDTIVTSGDILYILSYDLGNKEVRQIIESRTLATNKKTLVVD